MADEIRVFVDLNGVPILVGDLWVRNRDGRQSASFQYSKSWLQSPSSFAIDPFLPLGEGAYHTPDDRALDVKPRNLTTAIEPDNTKASISLAMDAAAYFDLDEKSARQIVREVAAASSRWRHVATSLGVKAGEIARMSTAFEHEDLKQALNL